MQLILAPLLSFFTWIVSNVFAWIGASLPWIAGFFGSTVAQILISVGFGVSSFTGFNLMTSYLLEIAVSGFAGLPSNISQLLGLMWVDKALNLMLSTAVALMTIKGLRAGTLMRSAWSAPGSKTGGFGA